MEGGSGRGLAGRQRELQGDVGTVLLHSPRQEAMEGVGTGRSGGDGEPLSIPCVHMCRHVHALSHTLSSAPHKSLRLNASAAAARFFNAAGRVFIPCRRYRRRTRAHAGAPTHTHSLRHTSSSWFFTPASQRELVNEHIGSLTSFAVFSSFRLYGSLGHSFCLIHSVKNHI